MKPPVTKRTWTFVSLIALVVAIYAVFEISIYLGTTTEEEQRELALGALESYADAFMKMEEEFSRSSLNFTSLIETRLQAKASKSAIKKLNEDAHFWGVSIFKNEDLWLWSGFAIPDYPEDASTIEERQHVTIKRDNNVIYLSSHIPFFIEEGDKVHRYDVFTRKKLQQENLIEIGTTSELSPVNVLETQLNYPVHFSFFKSLPENVQFQKTISTQHVDSAGVIYTLNDGFDEFSENKQNQYFLYRAVFYLLLILFTSLFLLSMAGELDSWGSLLLKLFAIISAWAFFTNIEYGLSWIELFPTLEQENIPVIKNLLYYSVNSFFFLLVTLAIFSSISFKLLKTSSKISEHISWINIVFGFLCTLLITFYFHDTYTVFKEHHISALDLNILPGLMVFIFYVASGVFSFSIIILLSLLGWFLLRSGPIPIWLQLSLMLLGFGLALFTLMALNIYQDSLGWLGYVSLIYFLFIQALFFLIFHNPFILKYASRLRILIFFGIFTSVITYTAVYHGYRDRVDRQMLEAGEAFVEEENSQEELITRELLYDLEESLSGLTLRDIQERQDFVESYFIQSTQQSIDADWENFSISAQLVDTNGNVIIEYTSELNPPSWTSDFLIQSLRLQFESERIRLDNLRPVISETPLNEATSTYSTFRRGWIPLHEVTGDRKRIAWILCSVYKERPQYDKPLRAVLEAENSKSWNFPVNLTEFVEGNSTRSSFLGVPLELPGLFQLPDSLRQDIQNNTYLFRNTWYESQQVRELFLAVSPNKIIRVATGVVELANHFFSVMRYFFSILIVGLIILTSLSWKKEINILGHNRRFRDRLIDRFTLASLLCLMVLSVTSFYAIKNQNEENVQAQMLSKVQNFAEALTEIDRQSEGESILSINELSSALDADLTIYKDVSVSNSTTPQIYGQHVLPQMLPWDVYQSLYRENKRQDVRRIKVGTHELLIGYQPWFDDKGEIAGIVAIPTFLKAPKFNQQLLATTSYLLGFYVLIFGFFIIGAAYISTQLTEPLLSLRQGLRKISSGDLETHLPVNSKDEIGSLTNAYNVMVDRLKQVRSELASAEREAAWQEMAQQVAHEIKNPLTPMKLSLQHLERQLNTSDNDLEKMKPKIRKIAKNLIEQIESLNHIASDFSTFAQPIKQEFVNIEVNSLLNSVAELYEPEDSIDIQTLLYPDPIYVRGVKEEIRRVLVNIVKNAYEAMEKGGKIKLSVYSNQEKTKVFIEIEDSGQGIPPENRQEIFVPNFSTKSSGTGLGLAISKKIIEEHNGSISFESNVGEGTIFRISLPRIAEEKD